jgi:hypothetical protein
MIYLTNHAIDRFKERIATHLGDACNEMIKLVKEAEPGNPFGLPKVKGKYFLHNKERNCTFVCEDRPDGLAVVTVRKPEVEAKSYILPKTKRKLQPVENVDLKGLTTTKLQEHYRIEAAKLHKLYAEGVDCRKELDEMNNKISELRKQLRSNEKKNRIKKQEERWAKKMVQRKAKMERGEAHE